MGDQWTPRVTARAELAELLAEAHWDRAEAVGLTAEDLATLGVEGRRAAEADRLQKEEIAAMSAERGARSALAGELFASEEALRDRLPAVIGDLNRAGDPLGGFLSRLSFARYRFRELTPSPPASGGEAQELRAVERVQRTDAISRFHGLAAFCGALLRPGREAIVARLAARGFSEDRLRALGAEAEAYVAAGRNRPKAAPSTAVEADAVAAQKRVWIDVRRMIRKAVKGDPALEAKYAEC